MKRIILTVMLMLALAGTPLLVAAQPTVDETSFTSALTGENVDLGLSGEVTFIPENYDLSEGRTVSEEYIWFTHGWSNFELVLISGENDAELYQNLTTDNMEDFYESFEIVDESVTDEHAWFIANAVYQGSPLVVYYDFQLDAIGEVDLVVMQFTAADELAADLEFVQEEVSIGGNPLLPDADAQALQSMVAGEDTATPVDGGDVFATPASGDAGTSRSERGGESRPGDLTQDSTDIDSTPVAVTGDWESMGLVSDTEWVSPNFDVSVTWDDATWLLPLDYEYAIYLNDDPLYDAITLETTDGLGYVFVTVEDAEATTPISLAGRWASPEYAESFDVETTVVETATTQTTASVIYETVNTRGQSLYVVLTATFLEDGTLVYSQVSAAPDTIHEVYGQYAAGVQVNGAPIDLTYTVDDITEIGGN